MKLLDQIKTKLQVPTEVTSVAIEVVGRSSYVFSFVVLRRNKKQIEKVSSGVGIEHLEDLIQALDVKKPIVLTLSGAGIIHKKLQSDQLGLREALPYMLPNSNADDFIYQKTYSSKGSAFYSVARKDLVDQWRTEFEEKGFDVLEVSLGPFAIQSVLPILAERNQEVHLGKFSLDLGTESVQSFGLNGAALPTSFHIGEEQIPGDISLPYFGGFQTVTGIPQKVMIESEELTHNQSEYLHKRIFKVGGWAALIFLFAILLINFLWNSSLQSENNVLQESYLADSLTLSQCDKLKTEIDDKEGFLKKAGWLDRSHASLFMDKVAQLTPQDVLLTGLSYQPIDKNESRVQRKTIYQTNKIRVVGQVLSATSINPWIKELEEEKWVSAVKVIDYEYDSKKKVTFFELEIAF